MERFLIDGPRIDGLMNYGFKLEDTGQTLEDFIFEILTKYPNHEGQFYWKHMPIATYHDGMVTFMYPRMNDVLKRKLKYVTAEGIKDHMDYWFGLEVRDELHN